MSSSNVANLEVIDAVKRGDLGELQTLLDRNPTLAAARDSDGLSAVLLAVYRNLPAVATFLVKHRDALTIFEAAALGNTDEIGRALQQRPQSVNEFSPDGFTALHLAAHFNRLAAARLLLDAGADLLKISRNALAVMPLHSAVAGRAYETSRLLLERGAPPNVPQAGGWLAVCYVGGTAWRQKTVGSANQFRR